MSYRSKYTNYISRKIRQSDRTQLNRIRWSGAKNLLGSEDFSEESDRYIDTVKALQSKLRGRSQFRGMGEEAWEQKD